MKYFEFFKLLEKKDHLINKLTTLSAEQKSLAIEFFTKHPNYESEIDWNRKDLTWDDFEKVINKERVSKSQIPNFVKEGEHYLTLYKEKGITIYQPLTYVASRYLASKEVAPYIEGKWCIAYQKERDYWDRYSFRDENVFLFIFTDDEIPEDSTKLAVQIKKQGFSDIEEIYNNSKDDLYDRYYDNAVDVLDAEWEDLTDAGELDPEEYPREDYIQDNLYNTLDIIIESDMSSDESYEYAIEQLIDDDTITIWNSDDESLRGAESLYCLNQLPRITLEGIFYLCQEAVNNLPQVNDMHNEDLKVSEKLEQLKAETIKKEFWNLYKKSQKKGTPFVYKGDLTLDTLYDIDEEDALFEKDSNNKIVGFKVKIDKLEGSIDLPQIIFTNMINFPTEVTGDFKVCLDDSITKLENCPRIVGGDFDIRHSYIQTLEGSPEYVGGDFLCGSRNSIKSLEALKGAPPQIDGIFKIEVFYNRPLSMDILNKLGLVNEDEVITDSRMFQLTHVKQHVIRDFIADILQRNGTNSSKYVQII